MIFLIFSSWEAFSFFLCYFGESNLFLEVDRCFYYDYYSLLCFLVAYSCRGGKFEIWGLSRFVLDEDGCKREGCFWETDADIFFLWTSRDFEICFSSLRFKAPPGTSGISGSYNSS
jgi:hypothetical protein